MHVVERLRYHTTIAGCKTLDLCSFETGQIYQECVLRSMRGVVNVIQILKKTRNSGKNYSIRKILLHCKFRYLSKEVH